MKCISKSIVVLSLILLTSCGHQTSHLENKNKQDYLIGSTLWVQNSAEYKALAYQAYNIAQDKLAAKINSNKKGKALAVILDADETIVDNSAYQATNILENKTYSSESWKAWVDKAQATAIPGALEFLNFAAKNNVEIFIVTNRKENEVESSFKNFKKLKFPIKLENIFARGKSSSKEERRTSIAQKYEIVLMLGDNMADFSNLFEKKNTADRAAASDALNVEFGRKMIVLPNPMYGDWESAIYDYNFSASEEQKTQIREGALKPIK